MAGGRPTDYTLELATDICEKIASRGAGLKTICNENPHFPNPDTIYLWINKYPEFSEKYLRAKKEQVTALVDDILEISDDSTRDVLIKQDRDGNDYEVCNTEFAARSRLRVDTRKWIAARLVPRLYGDNTLAQELAREIEELKQMIKDGRYVKADSSKAQENS